MEHETRNINPVEFLEALQKEFICLDIRSKIYPSKGDRIYFRKLLDTKRETILRIAGRNRLDNIFKQSNEYMRVFHEVVPEYGFPNFIYNVPLNDHQATFPFSGTALKITLDPHLELSPVIYGMTHKVIRETNVIEVILPGSSEITSFEMNQVTRLNQQETDRFFYYYPNNPFRTKEGNGILTWNNFEKGISSIVLNDKKQLSLPNDQIARIL